MTRANAPERRAPAGSVAARVAAAMLVAAWVLAFGQTRSLADAATFEPEVMAGLGLVVAGVVTLAVGADAWSGVFAMLTGGAVSAGSMGTLVERDLRLGAIADGWGTLALPLLVVLVMRVAGLAPLAPRARSALLVLLTAAVAVAVLAMLTWNMVFDPSCPARCRNEFPFLDPGPTGRAVLRGATAMLTVAAGAWLVSASVSGAREAEHTGVGRLLACIGGVLAGAAALGEGVLLLGRTLAISDGLGQHRASLLTVLGLLEAVGVLLIAAGMTILAGRTASTRIRIRRLADRIEAAPAPGTLAAVLAGAMGDSSVRVGYWVADGTGYVDEEGRPFHAGGSTDQRGRTAIERDREPIAVVTHRLDLDARTLTVGLGRSVLLALDNERLRAARLARLRDLRASRARIVAVTDAERRRLERDLHDGAQQRLLAISFDLRLARSAAERAGDADRQIALAEAESLALSAIEQLRRIARGIYPAVLGQAGLVPALRSLAEEASGPVEITTRSVGRLPEPVEMAAYEVVADVMAGTAHGGGLAVEATVENAVLRLDLRADTTTDSGWVERLEDRVGAAGGWLTTELLSSGGTLLHVELPCA